MTAKRTMIFYVSENAMKTCTVVFLLYIHNTLAKKNKKLVAKYVLGIRYLGTGSVLEVCLSYQGCKFATYKQVLHTLNEEQLAKWYHRPKYRVIFSQYCLGTP